MRHIQDLREMFVQELFDNMSLTRFSTSWSTDRSLVPLLRRTDCLHNEGEFYCSYYLQLAQDDEKWVDVGDRERINYIQQSKFCHLLFPLSFPQRWGFVYWPEKAFHTGGALFKQRWCKCAAFKHVTAVGEHEVCLFSNRFRLGGEKPLWRRQW